MRTSIYVVALLFHTIYSDAQVLNGGFENWGFINMSEVPETWETYTQWGDYSHKLVKDTSAYEGNYALKMIGGAVFSEGDCRRVVQGSAPNIRNELDSLTLKFAYKVESENPAGLVYFNVGVVGGNSNYAAQEETLEYKQTSLRFANPMTDTLKINIRSGGSGGTTDGCPSQCTSWVDALRCRRNSWKWNR